MAPNKVLRKKATPKQELAQPEWPLFKHLSLSSDLLLETLEPSQIVLIRNFWTETLCKKYVDFLKTLPLTTTTRKPRKGDALRFNDRFQIFDDSFANGLWKETGLQELICGGREGEGETSTADKREMWGGEVIGLNPSIRIYRYSKGQYFDQHYDESNMISLKTNPTPTLARTTWTLLLYLTSPATGCRGGETVFYPDESLGKKNQVQNEIVVGLETGMVLLHKHGLDCMLHEGREVLEGEKWVIRTDLCVKR